MNLHGVFRMRLVLLLAMALTSNSTLATTLGLQSAKDVDALLVQLPALAQQAIPAFEEADESRRLNTLFRLQTVAGQPAEARQSLERLLALRAATDPSSVAPLYPFLVLLRADVAGITDQARIEAAVGAELRSTLGEFDDLAASRALPWFVADAERLRDELDVAAAAWIGRDAIPLTAAIDLIRRQHLQASFALLAPVVEALTNADDDRRYRIDERVQIDAGSATIAALTIRPRAAERPLPTLLVFTIYADDAWARRELRNMAAHGYAGVVAYTRGKGHSPDAPVPYEHDGEDARKVIDWIARQPWSDGRVGMYGGSYNGFTQWAAAKRLPSALKTIVPYVANNPGDGLPMENNVFVFANYAWPFYVANNKYLDESTYFDHGRWAELNERWYQSGKRYRDIDAVDGTPNAWFQRWLRHPRYDRYWQRMVPHRREFARIDIPVLSITGYYDDGQQSAIRYLKEHVRYRPDAQHHLLIGPYDHFGAQAERKAAVVGGYAIDPVAMIDTPRITFEWMDHVFRGAPKPALLKDRINYQVMGANRWAHASSLATMANSELQLFLSPGKDDTSHRLVDRADAAPASVRQVVDFADRDSMLGDHYPAPVLGKVLDASAGLLFVSAPFADPIEVSGQFSGVLRLTANKRDLDFSVTLYEQMPDGQLLHLSYFLGRASHARSMSRRHLLKPGRKTDIPFDKTRLVSRQLAAGSRLLIAVTVNKNAYAQVNHGTGGDVSDEDRGDAGDALVVDFHNDSVLRIPVRRAAR